MRRPTCSLLAGILGTLSASVLATLPAQGRTYVVDASNGPGTDFTTLPPAVAAALAGDILRVRAGAYHHVVVTKGLRIVGEPGAVVSLPSTTPMLRIENIPVGETCGVSGLRVLPGSGLAVVEVVTSPGRVVLDRLDIVADPQSIASAVRIVDCAAVVVSHCMMQGSLAVVGSTAELVDTTCASNRALFTLPGSPALHAQASRLTIAFGWFFGGSAATAFSATAGPGLRMIDSEVVITGDSGTVFGAGTEGLGATSAIDGQRGNLRLHPAVTLAPVRGGPGVAPTLPVTLATTPGLRVRGAALGGSVTVAFASTPNTAYAILLGSLEVHPPVPGLGTLWLDLQAPSVLVAIGIQPQGGTHAFGVPVPLAPTLLGAVFAWQGAGDAEGVLRLSNVDVYVQG